MTNPKKRALGKGLGALLGDADAVLSPQFEVGDVSGIVGSVVALSLDMIEVNPFQPRTEFDDEALQQLAESIRLLGIIQPVTVRNIDKNKFQLISGERRFRASKLAGLTEIPAYVRVANDQSMLELALVENIQRQDLDAIEIAISYNRLIDECKITQEELSDRVGKKRSTITNYLRLLRLPPEIQFGIRENKISMGHARALVNIESTETQLSIFYDITENELSVRQVEAIVQDLKGKIYNKPKTGTKKEIELPGLFVNYNAQLSNYFDREIEIKRSSKGKGNISIPFETDEDFERIIELLKF